MSSTKGGNGCVKIVFGGSETEILNPKKIEKNCLLMISAVRKQPPEKFSKN